MPKRTLETTDTMAPSDRVPPAKAQKTERSHEENQERAYIAASRRADRSLEARVQSAKMASEIHRRRTGRGLKVSEEIVLKEEMYEEEEDDLPRQYRYLAAHLRTNSSDMNSRVSAYITTQAAMATMARYNEVNRLFSESFPTAMASQQQLNNSMYMQPLMNPAAGPYSPTSPGQMSPPASRAQSISGPAQYPDMNRRVSSANSTPNLPSVSSPPPLSPGATSHTTESRNTPLQTPAHAFPPLDPQLHQSSFTSELPNEVKMLANVDMSDPMAPYFFGGQNPRMPFVGQPSEQESLKQDLAAEDSARGLPLDQLDTSSYAAPDQDDEPLFSAADSHDGHFDFSQYTGEPGSTGNNEGAWESFVDFGPEH